MRVVAFLFAILCASSSMAFGGTTGKIRRAILADDNEALRLILRSVPHQSRMPTGQTWIDFAAENNSFKSLMTLLYDEGYNETNEPVMLTATRLGEARAIRKLAQHGLSVDAADRNGWRPLHEACDHAEVYIAGLLIALGADVDAQTPGSAYAPVHLAAGSGSAALLKILRQKGANMNAVTAERRTATFFAISSGKEECLQVLALAGVDFRKADKFGIEPVDFLEFALQFFEHKLKGRQRTAAILAFLSPRTMLPEPN